MSVKAGLCREPADWRWSSAAGHSDVRRADVPVGMAIEKANDGAGDGLPLAPHSLAGEDASVPRANGDVGVPDNLPTP